MNIGFPPSFSSILSNIPKSWILALKGTRCNRANQIQEQPRCTIAPPAAGKTPALAQMKNRDDSSWDESSDHCLTWSNSSSPFVHHLHQHLEQTTTLLQVSTSLSFHVFAVKPQTSWNCWTNSSVSQLSDFIFPSPNLLHHQRPLSKASSIDLALSIQRSQMLSSEPNRDSNRKWPAAVGHPPQWSYGAPHNVTWSLKVDIEDFCLAYKKCH